MLLLPPPSGDEPSPRSIALPLYDEDARRPGLRAELAAETAPYDPEDFDLDLAVDLLLERERANGGTYSRFDLCRALSDAQTLSDVPTLRDELRDFAAGWDAAVGLMGMCTTTQA